MEGNQKPSTALVQSAGNSVVATEETPGYWARVHRRYLLAFRVILVLLLIFAVLFASLATSAFSGDGIYYFAKDLTSLGALADRDHDTLYYQYGATVAAHAAFRGGAATAHDRGIEILAPTGEPSLHVERTFVTPRVVTSRHYVLAYDLGGTTFSLCNAYDELYHGTVTAPITYAAVSDTGSFAVVTAAVADENGFYPSEILLYNGNFQLTQRFKRSGACIAVALSKDGRYIAILGTAESGALLDIYARKASKPQASLTFEGFPCALGFTSSNTVAVLTDMACHTLRIDGKRQKSLSFEGQTLLAYDIDEKAVAVALQTDAVRSQVRLLACDKKGNIKYDAPHTDVYDISISDRTVWLLTAAGAVAVDLQKGVVAGTAEATPGAVAITGTGRREAKLFYPAYMTAVTVKD